MDELTVDCGKGESIQAAVDSAVDGTTIEVSGTCTEIVTVTTNGITIFGDPGVGGTLNGGFIFDGAQRGVVDNLTIDGSTNAGRLDGVRAQNNAHVTVRNSTIQNHTRSGVNITRNSSALVEGNTITVNEADGADSGVVVSLGSFAFLRGTAENPTQTITSDLASGAFGNSLGVFHDSHVRLNGGNTIVGSGAAPAIGVFNDASVRLQNGLNTVLGTGGRAINVGRDSALSLRFFDVTGRIDLSAGATAEIRRRLNVEPAGFTSVAAVITGDIRVRSGAQVEFPSPFLARNGSVRQGSVTVNGVLRCFGNQGHVTFDTRFGQTIQDVFPSEADRLDSQCNDFNGIPVLPPPFKTVFVTLTSSTANLGGLAGADAICQARADAAGLGGTYLAWLSAGADDDFTSNPAARFTRATIPYKRTDAVVVADDFDDLVDCGNPNCLQVPIDRDETGAPLPPSAVHVWTNTTSGGERISNTHCQNWTSESTSLSGNAGHANRIDQQWTLSHTHFCSEAHSLYCFQQ